MKKRGRPPRKRKLAQLQREEQQARYVPLHLRATKENIAPEEESDEEPAAVTRGRTRSQANIASQPSAKRVRLS